MISRCKIVLLSVLLAGTAWTQPNNKLRLADLSWLTGCWGGPVRAGTFEECWTRPLGDSMQGSSRIVTPDGKTAFREFMVIEESAEGIVMTLQHVGHQMSPETPPVSFTLRRNQNGEAVFENPQHDSPQRIIYRKQADGSILARVEKLDGTEASEFPMRTLMAPQRP